MPPITVEHIKKIGQIKDSLLGCPNEESVNAVFNQFGIDDFPLKTTFLRYSMQVQDVFDAPIDQSIDQLPHGEAAYREELRFFLDGKWKELV